MREVKTLYNKELRDVQSVKAIGYKELYDYFDGIFTLEEAIDQLKQNSRNMQRDNLHGLEIKWMLLGLI